MAVNVYGQALRRWRISTAEHLAHLLHLWINDLVALLPEKWRERWRRTIGPPDPFVVEPGSVEGSWVAAGSKSPLAPETIRSRTRTCMLVLRIEESGILRRRLSLPPAAAARLDDALGMNLGAWTPFSAQEVYVAAHAIQQAPLQGIATAVELRCVPRPFVDARIASLKALSLDPDAIELGDARFTLPRATRKRHGIRQHRWLLASLALLLLAQCIGAYAALTNRQRSEIETLEADRAAMLKALRQQADTQKATGAQREGLLKISTRIDDDLSVSRAMRLLAAALPEAAVIREFELGRDRAEGHVAILGPAGLDIAVILSKTGSYSVRDLNVLSASDADRKVFSTRFVVTPWVQAGERSPR